MNEQRISIAYVVNLYPAPSHTFIRREIAELERLGAEIVRYSIRSDATALVDEADKAELERTAVVLDAGVHAVLGAFLRRARYEPLGLVRALSLTWRSGLGSRRGLLRHFASLAEACVLRDWTARRGCTHVHAHFESSTTVAMLLECVGGPCFSFTVHGPEEIEEIERKGLSLRLAKARFVVAISDYTKRALTTDRDARLAAKIHVLPCGVDESFLVANPTPVPDVPRFVSVGRLVSRKGHAVLLRAAALLAEEGHVFSIDILGEGPLRAQLCQQIEDLGLSDRVALSGCSTAAAIRTALHGARALVLPSLAEGLPVTILEAFALGRPVIASSVAGIPEIVDDQSGWLVPPGSVEALAEALRRVLATPTEELTAMAARGRQRVAERHDARKTAGTLLARIAAASKERR